MKLKFNRKPKATKENTDLKKQGVIKLRMTQVSEDVRRQQLASDAQALPRNSNVRIKLTRKNSTLNSAPEEAGHPADSEIKWKGRRFHGRHLPVLQCNACSISRVCPKFKAGYECAYLPYLNSHKVETVDDLLKYMKLMVGNSMKRAQLMSIIETANGGMPSLETSEALDMAFRQLKELNDVMTAGGDEESVEIEGESSIVGSIFGGLSLKKVLEETEKMKRVDPVINLPEVPQSPTDTRASLPPSVSEELLRDALLGMENTSPQSKKDLRQLTDRSISQSEIQRSP